MLVVAVVSVAYGTHAPSLGVAEFAPAARQRVDAPPSTAGDQGSGAGRGRKPATSGSTTTTAASPADSAAQSSAPTTKVARTRQCVGSPPRQIEDPQAPPCMTAIFEGDNGGATSRGVTGTEIRVAVPNQEATTNDQVRVLFDYFNQRFEFYGRRLVPTFVAYRNGYGSPTRTRALAEEIAALGAFAALDHHMDGTQPSPWLHQALARSRVISIVGRDVPYSNQTVFDEGHPYVWGVHPSLDEIWQATSTLVCKLAGRPATHAGGALRSATRKFGIIVAQQASAEAPLAMNQRQLVRGYEACGIEPEVVEVAEMWDATQRRTAMSRMKAAGVTTLVCACRASAEVLPSGAQEVGDFVPEMLLPHFLFNIEALERDLAWMPEMASHVFGVFQQPKTLPSQARPFFQAMLQMNPSFSRGNATGSDYGFFELEGTYRQLLLLSSGIQGAGPDLTVDSFAAALMTMQFPNPGAGQAPFWQSAVDFGPGDHTMYGDVALAWWNPTISATSVLAPVGAAGSWCFLGGGTRFRPGEIPADADSRFFSQQEPCR